MTDVILSMIVVAAAGGVGWLVHLIRTGRLASAAASAVSASCAVALLTMILTDWPLEGMARFWADHSVVAGVLSSLLLVGLVFMVYERAEQQRQDELAEQLSGAGLGGVVDHIVDLEVALALATSSTSPADANPAHWSNWREPGKPLRWMQNDRKILESADDPRVQPLEVDGQLPEWADDLIDQSIRRLLAAMRDWTPLIGASAEGTNVLVLLSKIRSDLMRLQVVASVGRQYRADEHAAARTSIIEIRRKLRVLAICFEDWSGAQEHRPEVRTTLAPLPLRPLDLSVANRSLNARLTKATASLRGL